MANQKRTLVRMTKPDGTFKDVTPDQAHALASQGYSKSAESVGTTAQRPSTGLFTGFRHYDTTLSKMVVWQGGGGGMQHETAPESGFWTDGSGASV